MCFLCMFYTCNWNAGSFSSSNIKWSHHKEQKKHFSFSTRQYYLLSCLFEAKNILRGRQTREAHALQTHIYTSCFWFTPIYTEAAPHGFNGKQPRLLLAMLTMHHIVGLTKQQCLLSIKSICNGMIGTPKALLRHDRQPHSLCDSAQSSTNYS